MQIPYYLNPDLTYVLPPELNEQIGKVIVRWAFLEFTVQKTIWALSQVTHPIGRLAIREPRLEDRVQLLENLADLRGIQIPQGPLDTLHSNAKSLAKERDTLAHGLWFRERGIWHVILTRGKWEAADNEPHPSKSVVPEALEATDAAIATIVAGIEATIRLAQTVDKVVTRQLAPPPEAHPSQLPRKAPKQDRSASGHARQRGPSPRSPQMRKRQSSAQRRKEAIAREARKRK